MKELESLMSVADWVAQNVNHNLNFVPDDKLEWQPAPDAKSVLDIAHEVALSTDSIAGLIETGQYQKNVARPTTREEAQEAIKSASTRYQAALRAMTPEKLADTAHFPWGDMPMRQAVEMPVIEMTHHHGQIAYIQTLWGDTDSHFFQFGT